MAIRRAGRTEIDLDVSDTGTTSAARRPLTVALVGPTGVGKTTIAKEVAERMGANVATRVPVDQYTRSRGCEESWERYFGADHYDWALLAEHLAAAIGQEVSSPSVDFDEFRRLSESGGPTYPIRRILLLDASWPFPSADVLVLVTLDRGARRQRIIQRSAERQGRDRKWLVWVLQNWDADIPRTPELVDVDIVVDASLDVSVSVERIVTVLATRERSSRRPTR